MAQQSAEESPTADAVDLRRWSGSKLPRQTRCCGRQCAVAEPLVRSMFVQETDVPLTDVVEMTEAETQEVAQTFALQSHRSMLS